MHGAIFQCEIGHSLCINCYTQVTVCPICRAPKTTTRSIGLETLVSASVVPCKNRHEGCKFIDLGSYILEHESNCLYGLFPCLLKTVTGCNWAGELANFLPHIKLHHRSNLHLNGEPTTIRNFVKEEDTIDTDNSFHSVITTDNEIFKCLVNVNYPSGKMQWDVFYYGRESSPRDYIYEIRIKNFNKSNDSIFLSSCCAHFQREGSFEKNMCLLTNYHVLKKMCKGKDLVFNVKVYRKGFKRYNKRRHGGLD